MRCKYRIDDFYVGAAPKDVRQVAEDTSQRAAWGGEWCDWGPEDAQNLDPKKYEKTDLYFRCSRRPKGNTQLYLHLALAGTGSKTKVTARVVEHFGIALLPLWLWCLGPGRPGRKTDLLGALHRLRGLTETPHWMDGPSDWMDFNRDNLLTLLTVYTTQFGSYTTLLWQVPALGLAAQAFLMLIVLGSKSMSSDGSKYAASALSIIIAIASERLMHTQRGRAINQDELVKRVSRKLSLKDFLGGDFTLGDAVPKIVNAEDVWRVNHTTYHFWQGCMVLFIVVDALVIISTAAGFSWFTT